MPFIPLPSFSPRQLVARRRNDGFTLVEAGLVLTAVALAAYVALAEMGKFRHRAQRDRFVEELRGFATAFETYRTQKGVWPAATNPEVRVPPGMESALANTTWQAGPPFGGSYDWIPPSPPAGGAGSAANAVEASGRIAVTAFSPGPPLNLSTDDLLAIDAKLDDGNLSTGRFRTGFNRWPVYLVPVAR